MKKLLTFFVVLGLSTVTFAQIANWYPVTKEVTKKIDEKDSLIKVIDSAIVINGIYVGMLAGTMFSIDSLDAGKFVNLRFATMATYKPAKWIAFKTRAVYQFEGPGCDWLKTQFWTKIIPTKKSSIEFGLMPTISSEQRPDPVSGDGQFETWSEASIPGMILNAKIKYQFTKNLRIGTGVAVRNKLPEYSAGIVYNKIQLSGWYAKYDSLYGSALTVGFERIYSTFVYKQNQTIADILVVKLGKKKDICLYSDMGYDLSKNNKGLVRGEWGVYKDFSSPLVKGLLGIGYQYEIRSIVGYLFLHL